MSEDYTLAPILPRSEEGTAKTVQILKYEYADSTHQKFWIRDVETKTIFTYDYRFSHWGDALTQSNCEFTQYEDNGFSTVIDQLIQRQVPIFMIYEKGDWWPDSLLAGDNINVMSFRVWLSYDSLFWDYPYSFNYEYMEEHEQLKYVGTEIFRLAYEAIPDQLIHAFLPLVIEYLGYCYDSWQKR